MRHLLYPLRQRIFSYSRLVHLLRHKLLVGVLAVLTDFIDIKQRKG